MDEPVTPLESLGERVAEVLAARAEERKGAIERARQGYMAEAFRALPRRSGRSGLALLAALSCVLIGAGTLAAALRRPLEFTAGGVPARVEDWVAASDGLTVPLSFSDGTELRLEPFSRARVVSLHARGASVVLEDGELHADVAHAAPSAWRVIAGPLTVRVTGTRFSVRWNAVSEEFSLSVGQGAVVVEGSGVGSARHVRAGETLRLLVGERASADSPARANWRPQ